jgi:predicted NodU family carbamoyl transferase
MLAKTVKPATAWREANSSRDNKNITASTAERETHNNKNGKIAEPSQQQYYHQQGRQQHNMDANNTLWTPTAQCGRQQLMSFRRNSPKSCQSGAKFVKKYAKKSKNSLVFVR